jgi:hypothetical protein
MEECSAPMAVITEITEKTPIVMPIIVSAARSLFAPNDASAILIISLNTISPGICLTAESAEFAEEDHNITSSTSPKTLRRSPFFNSSTLKLINNPIFQPPSFR